MNQPETMGEPDLMPDLLSELMTQWDATDGQVENPDPAAVGISLVANRTETPTIEASAVETPEPQLEYFPASDLTFGPETSDDAVLELLPDEPFTDEQVEVEPQLAKVEIEDHFVAASTAEPSFASADDDAMLEALLGETLSSEYIEVEPQLAKAEIKEHFGPAPAAAPSITSADDDAMLEALLGETLSSDNFSEDTSAAEPVLPPTLSSEDAFMAGCLRNLDERLAWAAKLQMISNAPAPLPSHRFVQFTLAGDCFAVPVTKVLETGYLPEVTPLPAVDTAVRGLINYRGDVLPVLNLLYLLGRGGDSSTSQAQARDERVIIVRASQSLGACALPVDGVAGLLSLWPDEIRPAKEEMAGERFVKGLGDRQGTPVRLLDLEQIFAALAG
ncbi:MAG: chemotaxis protein CheW [Acidobacteria bacterium]|nr:chemotaxis protein CheW [Acidobacteriota bacterium]